MGVLGLQALLALLCASELAVAKGGGHGGSCGHGGHGAGHAHVTHASGGGGGRVPWLPARADPRQVWHCGFFPINLGISPVVVQRSCGAPETARQVVYGDDQGEHVIDVWSYHPPDSAVHVLKFDNGALISVEIVGPPR